MKVLVTGLAGFAGTHLGRLLEKSGFPPLPLALAGRRVDITDAEAVSRAIAETRPDRVYHLAAIAGIARSWRERGTTFAVNVEGTRNLVSALLEHAPDCRLLLVSTGNLYGEPGPEGRPFTESDPPRPLDPYSESKLEAERVCREAFDQRGLDIRIARPLGHTGPGQKRQNVVPEFASQVAEVLLNKREPVIRVGNLEVWREFGDVRDMVRGYQLVMEAGEPGGIYNLATNEPRSIREVLETLMRIAGVNARLEPDPERLRPSDYSTASLDTERIAALGFSFRIPFEKTLADVFAEQLERARNS